MEHTAIERLKMASDMSLRLYKQPLVITYSGGKDSDVLLHLAGAAEIPYEVLHSLTTADAPETVRHVLDTFRRLELDGVRCDVDTHKRPDGTNVTMWNLIPRKLMPPTRMVRYCCSVLKETGGRGRWIATGVRWAESPRRKKRRGSWEISKRARNVILANDNDESRQMMESCQLKGQRTVNPIIDWQDADIWGYGAAERIQFNPLYACGFCRVGCVGCPLAKKAARQAEFERYPKIKAAYIRAFERMLQKRKEKGKMEGGMRWGNTGEDVMHWWMEDGVLPGQMVLDEVNV